MTSRPYELLARFGSNGTVAGVSVRTINTINGRDYESDPQPLSGVNDAAFTAFAAAFSASIVAQRDTLLAEKTALAAAVQSLTAERNSLQSQVDSLTEQLDEALNPPVNPRHIAPFTFLGRFTTAEIYSLLTSTDPIVVVAVAKLQTIITYVDLDLEETQNLIAYLVQTQMLTQQRADQILA